MRKEFTMCGKLLGNIEEEVLENYSGGQSERNILRKK